MTKHPVRGLFSGIAGLILTGFFIWTWEPNKWWNEVIVIMIGFLSVLVVFSWVFKKFKIGIVIASVIFGFLILNRLGILDPVSGILLVLVLGLITLVN